MIALHRDCLVFRLNNGESIPCSPEMIAVEVVGEANGALDPELLRHAAASVFHYFKTDLDREVVTIGEFSLALEKALHHLGYSIRAHSAPGENSEISDADLELMVAESSDSLELIFFARLRDELRVRLRNSPRVVRFHGLRGCVKQLVGARRWNHRCADLQDQIVDYLRGCLTAEAEQNSCALVVE